jgi:hypothetical protein
MTSQLVAAARDTRPVAGLTHNFYRYPARFSPLLVRAVLERYTKPGDVIVDPFMGGGTTLVEAAAMGRVAIGADLNELAVFIAKTKTRLITTHQASDLTTWASSLERRLRLGRGTPIGGLRAHMPKRLATRETWPVVKSIAMALEAVEELQSEGSRSLARCAVLRTGQWALDGRVTIPTAHEFRTKLAPTLLSMVTGALQFTQAVAAAPWPGGLVRLPECIGIPAEDLADATLITRHGSPRLILTSPPYPGVHVLYHRWQVRGRRETPAPYWIAGAADGAGPSHYTFAHRTNSTGYFRRAQTIFRSLSRLAGPDTLLVQVVGFSHPSSQLPAYLSAMQESGFDEVTDRPLGDGPDGRVWRRVPNRKWYTDNLGHAGSEVVLIHRKA